MDSILPNDDFTYTDGRLGPNEIRLLVLLPADHPEADIHCHMKRYNLETTDSRNLKEHPFFALSYVWGSNETEKTIFIDGRRKKITPNLYDALLQIRRSQKIQEDGPVPLWIDAVCINQDDLEERAQQVGMMANIYSRVLMVLCWLGPVGNMGRDNISSEKSIWRLWDVFTPENETGNLWTSSRYKLSDLNHDLFLLWSLPFWQRVWITQEVVLAPCAGFLWGPLAIDLTVFEKLLEVQDRFIPDHWYGALDRTRSAGLFANFTQIFALRSKRASLQGTLMATRHRLASNARDYIYGVLAIAQLGNLVIVPDYKKTVKTVFLEAFKVITQQESNLDALSMCRRGFARASEMEEAAGQDSWPTWLPDWSQKSQQKTSSDREFTADLMYQLKSVLLDCQDYDPVEFSATSGLDKVAHILPGNEQFSVRGIEFDTLEIAFNDPEPTFWFNDIKILWDRGYLRNVYDNLHVLWYACMRTARYGHRNSVTAIDIPPLFADNRHVVEETILPTIDSSTPAFEPFDEEEKLESEHDKVKTDGAESTDMFLLGISKSSYFITRRGYVGRSPVPVKVGDKVCIFFGGKVPFLLRQKPSSEFFTLVGEAYIHGIMKGAAVDSMRDEWKDFVLV
ncbi:heterokaryon incompatibility protein-domain-containing protein [Whalleya microplaca]|nr:heterokaryon incompatibility protein-domain-containing protein [Whalleya microplaca]